MVFITLNCRVEMLLVYALCKERSISIRAEHGDEADRATRVQLAGYLAS